MTTLDFAPLLADLVASTEALMDSLDESDAGSLDADLITQTLDVRAELLSRLPPGSSLTAAAKTSLHHLCELDEQLQKTLAVALDTARSQLSQVHHRQARQHSTPRLVLESA